MTGYNEAINYNEPIPYNGVGSASTTDSRMRATRRYYGAGGKHANDILPNPSPKLGKAFFDELDRLQQERDAQAAITTQPESAQIIPLQVIAPKAKKSSAQQIRMKEDEEAVLMFILTED